MNWIPITDESNIQKIKDSSSEKPQVIFKHSTRCSISSMAKSRLERSAVPEGIDFHYLDLLTYRSISNLVASEFKVEHASPQVLLIKDGVCVYDESHSGIDMKELASRN
ncbi:MAG: bacillithiol system redox-active protein YtxJ [Ferruginibacter sp.]